MTSIERMRCKKLLKNNGYSVTRSRLSLFDILQDHSALSHVELIAKLSDYNRVTIYRNVAVFEKLGIVSKTQIGWKTKIELSDLFVHHHHHMSCTKCGKVLVLRDNQVIEREIARISQGTGFKATDHQLEIRGQCKNCRKA